MSEQRAVHQVGDGLVWIGPCLVTHIIFMPSADAGGVTVYDGRDATSGKKFHKLVSAVQTTRHMSLGQGVRFDVGVYLDAVNAADETTVVFVPA